MEKNELGDGWVQVISGKKGVTPTIAFSKGKAKYIRFSRSFLKMADLSSPLFVSVFVKKEDNKHLIAFKFNEERSNGMLNVSINKAGTGYISGAGIYAQIGLFKPLNEKKVFTPKEKYINDEKYYIIEFE